MAAQSQRSNSEIIESSNRTSSISGKLFGSILSKFNSKDKQGKASNKHRENEVNGNENENNWHHADSSEYDDEEDYEKISANSNEDEEESEDDGDKPHNRFHHNSR